MKADTTEMRMLFENYVRCIDARLDPTAFRPATLDGLKKLIGLAGEKFGV